jgi:peptidylprolyl isomerase
MAVAIVGMAAAEDLVVAQRGQDQITLSEARALIATADPAVQHRLATDQAALKTFLRDVLVQRAILEAAQAEKWEDRPDVAALLRRAHNQVVADSFLAAHATLPAGYPTDADIQAAYDQNKSRLMQPRTYHLLQLTQAKTQTGSIEEARKKLLALRPQLQRGRLGFEDAAKRNPALQYADIGWVSEAQLTASAKTAVAGLLEGGITDPLCGEAGCQLVKLVATRTAGPASLADARDALVRALKQQKQADLERAYASGLLAKQPIAINEIQLTHIVP